MRAVLGLVAAGVVACGATEPGVGDGDGGAPDARSCAGPPYPIVLGHGFTGFDGIGPINYYFGVAEELRGRGETVFEAEVAPYQSSAVRGTQLAVIVDGILETTGACKVVLVVHSQGGLDARFMVSTLGYGDRVAAMVTIATPHRGTRLADVLLELQPGITDDLVDFAARLIGRVISGVGDDPDLRAAMESLAEATAAAFGADNPDDPRVAYYSVAGRSLGRTGVGICDEGLWPNPPAVDTVEPFLAPSAALLEESSVDPRINDGLVTVESARWGTFLGCVPADHMDEIGQIADLQPDPSSGWSHKAFYVGLVELLRDAGY